MPSNRVTRTPQCPQVVPLAGGSDYVGSSCESARANAGPTTQPLVGQPFNPYKRFAGAFVPEPVCMYRGISPGAKLIYGRLCRYVGKNGVALDRKSAVSGKRGRLG